MSNQSPPNPGRTRTGRHIEAEIAPRAVSRILRMIRPSFRSDGGNIELVGIKNREVVIRLSGACDDCPISFDQSSAVLNRIIRSRMPQIETLTVI